MKKAVLLWVLAALTLLTSCGYIVVEDRPSTQEALVPAQEQPTPSPTLPPLTGMQRGDEGDRVASVQEKLIRYGFMTGRADGVYGSGTDSGVKSFNRYLGEKVFLSSRFRDFDADGGMNGDAEAYLLAGHFDPVVDDLSAGDSGPDVRRIQTRLLQLDYLTEPQDGAFGGNTEDALRYFQKRNGLEETGVADRNTQKALFSDEAKKSDRPLHRYLLKISTRDQKVYAYEWENGEYKKLVRTMVCSTGTYETPTPLGTFRAAGACGRWYYFKKYDCWAQYAYRITGGILFHSVIYSEKDTSTLRQSSVSNLGSRASHGCIRLQVEDARWIYNNCPAGTTVKVV